MQSSQMESLAKDGGGVGAGGRGRSTGRPLGFMQRSDDDVIVLEGEDTIRRRHCKVDADWSVFLGRLCAFTRLSNGERVCVLMATVFRSVRFFCLFQLSPSQ